MKGFADAMAAIGKPLSEDEVLGYMLAGLGSEFEPLVASITARDDPVSLSSFYAFLLSAEIRLEQQNSTREIHSSANAAARGNGARGRQGGQARGRGGRGRGNGRSNLKCQVCSKFGHDTLHCRN